MHQLVQRRLAAGPHMESMMPRIALPKIEMQQNLRPIQTTATRGQDFAPKI